MTEPVPDSVDLIPALEAPTTSLDYRQGVVVEWNPVAGTNKVNVGGGMLDSLAVITESNLIGLKAGDVVALLKYNSSYAILGRLHRGISLGTPWQPVPLYPEFTRLAATGVTAVNVGTLASWSGSIYATHHTHLQIDGTFGQLTGSNTTTFNLTVGAGAIVGTWTETGTLTTGLRGPFSIVPYMNVPWLRVALTISSSTGSGTVAFNPVGLYLRTLA